MAKKKRKNIFYKNRITEISFRLLTSDWNTTKTKVYLSLYYPISKTQIINHHDNIYIKADITL